MTIIVIISDSKVTAKLPFHGADHVIVQVCPACSTEVARARGLGISHRDHDTYYAAARMECCGAEGRMEARVETIFGIEEDEAVLVHGRARVYS